MLETPASSARSARARALLPLLAGLALCIGLAACIGPGTQGADGAEASESDSSLPLSGRLTTRLVGRATDSGSSDIDLTTTAAVDVGDEEKDDFTFHVLGKVQADLGGHDPEDRFVDLHDTLDGAVDGLLLHGYVDAHRIPGLDLLRFGRQTLRDTPVPVFLDGLRAETTLPGDVRLGAYGGLRVQHYDRSAPEDVVAGVYGLAHPWKGGRVRIDFASLEDDERLGSDQEDLLGAEVRHVQDGWLTLEAGYTRLEGRDRDLTLRGLVLDPDVDLTVQVSYRDLLRTQRNHALETDPFFSTLLEQRPYRQLGLSVTKGFAEALDLSLGVDLRRLHDASDAGEFNHEFDHASLTAVLLEPFYEGLDVTLVGDVFRDDLQDTETWGLDLTQELDERMEASLGSYYSLFKYDLFLASERDNVRTYYARWRWRRTTSLTFDVEYELENDGLETWHRLTLGTRWHF